MRSSGSPWIIASACCKKLRSRVLQVGREAFMDLASVAGTLLGLFAVFGGALIEGLHPGDIMVGTAALIVFGGTLAALLLSYPPQDVRRAFAMLPLVYQTVDLDVRPLIAEIVRVATI